MLFPMIAGGFGFLPPGAIVWSMLMTNVAAMVVGTILAAKLAEAWGAYRSGSGWMFPLNIGLLFELEIGGAGILAYACCLGALYALVTGRHVAGVPAVRCGGPQPGGDGGSSLSGCSSLGGANGARCRGAS